MKKLSVILIFIIPCILFLVLRTVCFGDQIIEGIINDHSPVWDRIKNSDSTISTSCNAVVYDSYNDEVRYKKFLISSSSAEELSVTIIYASENYDPLLALYCEPFDPDNPENNLIAIDDDSAGYPYPRLNNIPLASDTNYFLVISSYSNYQPWGYFRINLQGNFIVDEGPWEEICDGIDNDDDGQIDEDLGFTTCGLGECEHTIDNCVNGIPRVCNPLEGAVPEMCDGKDNNCNGDVDEGVLISFYMDADKDGYGDPNSILQQCSDPNGYVLNQIDCDDSDPNVNPMKTATGESLVTSANVITSLDSSCCPYSSAELLIDLNELKKTPMLTYSNPITRRGHYTYFFFGFVCGNISLCK